MSIIGDTILTILLITLDTRKMMEQMLIIGPLMILSSVYKTIMFGMNSNTNRRTSSTTMMSNTKPLEKIKMSKFIQDRI